jgi:hypothetical protein
MWNIQAKSYSNQVHVRFGTRLLYDNLRDRTHVKTIKPMVNLESRNDPDTLNQAQEQIRQGN